MINKEDIVEKIYNSLDSVYCYNCAFNSEVSEKEFREKNGYYGCEDCYRKYMNWRISKKEAENIANEIIKIINEQY